MARDQISCFRTTTTGKVPPTTGTVVGEVMGNVFDGVLYLRGNNGSDFVQSVGGPGFLNSGVNWSPASSGASAQENYEYGQKVYLFAYSQLESLTAWVRVPRGYVPGTQILLRAVVYSPSSSNNVRLSSVATLIRRNTDAVTSVANQRTSTNADLTLTNALQYREVVFDLTDASGLVNGVAVNPNDLLILNLTRIASSGTEDTTNDLRLVADISEITFN